MSKSSSDDLEYCGKEMTFYAYISNKGKNGWTGKSNNLRALGAKRVNKGAYYMIIDLGNGETLKQTIMINY